MTFHAVVEYIKYLWNAKSRHGIHSPFVFNFTEQVLRNRVKAQVHNKETAHYKWMGRRYHKLFIGLLKYFGFESVLIIPPEVDDETGNYDVLVLKNDCQRQWVRLLNKHLHLINAHSVVYVHGIHHSHGHTTKWNRLCNHPKVKMTIDVYGAGLLFFNEDFKEKQSFVLRY